MEAKAHYYNVSVKWESDRKGLLSSPELVSSVEVVTPPQFPKGIDGIWSPEHLFVAAVNSCLMTTFLSIAESSKLDYISFESNAKGKLEIVESKYMMSEVILEPVLVIKDIQQKEKAERVLQKSEANCLISNSIRSRIVFNPKVIVSEG